MHGRWWEMVDIFWVVVGGDIVYTTVTLMLFMGIG